MQKKHVLQQMSLIKIYTSSHLESMATNVWQDPIAFAKCNHSGCAVCQNHKDAFLTVCTS